MTSFDVAATTLTRSRPWNVETGYEFQPPSTVADGLHSTSAPAPSSDTTGEPVKLNVDPRVLEGRRAAQEDEREFGPVSENVLNEVRSRWPD